MRRIETHTPAVFRSVTAALAVALCACSAVEESPAPHSITLHSILALHGAGASSLCGCLNLFIYEDAAGYPLESCQEISCSDSLHTIGTTAGDKIAVLLANIPSENIFYSDISDFEAFSRMTHSIYDENPRLPVMCGVTRFRAGAGQPFCAVLDPILCRLELSSLDIDFSSSSMQGKELENVRAYLTNVNGNCRICDTLGAAPTDILNHGHYDPAVTSSLRTPSMLYSSEPVPGTEFFFYPSDCSGDEALSMPPTRLVIQGDISGHTYYYPIEIAGGRTLRGHSYIYDVTITGYGTTDPDLPALPGSVSFAFKVLDWIENEEEVEEF